MYMKFQREKYSDKNRSTVSRTGGSKSDTSGYLWIIEMFCHDHVGLDDYPQVLNIFN